MRLVIEKCILGRYQSHKLLCTPTNTDGVSLSQSELMENTLIALRNLHCLYGEYGHPYKQPNQSNEDYFNRCLEIDMTQACISFQGYVLSAEEGKIKIHFDFAGGQTDAFEEALRNNTVDLGARTITTKPLTVIAFDVIQKLT